MIYLDNSATSYPKPEKVRAAVKKAYRKFYANAGRGSSKDALRSANEVYSARETLGALVNTSPENIIFTYNATYALNMALYGVIKEGMTVAVDRFSHNSVLRPLYSLSKKGVKLRFLDSSILRDSVIIDSFERLSRTEKIDVLVLNHTSNVTGKVAPVRRLADACRESGTVFIVDASQGIGPCDIDMKALSIDILASSGHKGLYGVTGSGFLAVSDGFPEPIEPLITGGSGIFSMSREMPALLPERLEAGTLGMISISSMKAGAEFIMEVGSDAIGEWEKNLRRRMINGLMNMNGVHVYNADINAKSIVLFNIDGKTSTMTSDALDKYGFAVRGGYHCAPLAHELLGTNNPENDGAVRVSLGIYNSEHDVDKFLKAVEKIKKSP
ncbi:MAG: aminotransferase class V-fold PLP-dependent enzyme [Clostridia bacterium]|nr:aminotransferase class V-fold PLP-dependent enzyme [Clostridia bacterium]